MVSISYVALAGQTEFSVTFDFLTESDLSVFLDGSLITDWGLINGTTVKIGASPTILKGSVVLISRSTSIDELEVDFTATSSIRERELDLAFRQLLLAMQEISLISGVGLRKNPTSTAWEGEGLELKNLVLPTESGSAATKGYVDTALAGDGILPTPTVADIGKGIRVRPGPIYDIAPISGALQSYVISVADSNALDAANLSWGGYSINQSGIIPPSWAALPSTRVPLQEETTFLEPQAGAISLDPNKFDILLPRGTYKVEVEGSVRSLVTNDVIGLQGVSAALTDESGSTVFDRVYYRALGAGGGAEDPPLGGNPLGVGQPMFPFEASAFIKLWAIINVPTTQKINLRLSTTSSHQVVADVPFRVVVTDMPQ